MVRFEPLSPQKQKLRVHSSEMMEYSIDGPSGCLLDFCGHKKA